MGSGLSRLCPCIDAATAVKQKRQKDLVFTGTEALDETLGHSFVYVRSSARFLSPSHSDRLSPSQSLRLSPSHETTTNTTKTRSGFVETAFKSISGASVSANTSTPRSVLQHDDIYEDATDTFGCGGAAAPGGPGAGTTTNNNTTTVHGFESSSSFCALPLQPIPRSDSSGPIERGFFMSGPIERGALSGPLDLNTAGIVDDGHVPFSAPLNGLYLKRKRKKGLTGIRKAFSRSLSEKKRPWVVPVLNFVGRKDGTVPRGHGNDLDLKNDNNVQWAHMKAGEDRVHVVVSEEHGWLFVGIYDGFNGPDAPEFLMGNLYRAVFNELEGLFWDAERDGPMGVAEQGRNEEIAKGSEGTGPSIEVCGGEVENSGQVMEDGKELDPMASLRCGSVKKVTFQSDQTRLRRPLWEFLAEDADDGLDLSGSERFAFSVDDAVRVSNAGSVAKRQSLLLSKLKYGFSKHKEGQGNSRRFFSWRYDSEDKEKTEVENRAVERPDRSLRKRRVGPVDHELVLRAISRGLELTELAYLDMTDKVLDRNPELALMGSCLLVVLMRDEDVYVMNVGDSRALVAQYQPHATNCNLNSTEQESNQLDLGSIVEESSSAHNGRNFAATELSAQAMKLIALQLSTDHSTSIEEEVLRIKQEHPDDSQCIVNDRVKGRLKVTRAFGAGFLKQPKLNNALLEMFRNEYIGTAPYISCSPSLRHHKLGNNDQFLILSSDGLYQYLSNEEVVSHVENFMDKFPEGDPAQHLIEELLFRAAKKAGMDFHELLDIPQGDRRKYHDDVTVMVISLEGRIWKSSGKYL
ncbi:phosphatase 2C [Thalictrum thalictroides]|uniref:Phosphatase 2C n=1 Tax=Thalictrum thalictroides TaxID=46969 RepID=A0A7J6WQ73_THATH|nr:phosphatase 2C [Thalictrum thalictroides]